MKAKDKKKEKCKCLNKNVDFTCYSCTKCMGKKKDFIYATPLSEECGCEASETIKHKVASHYPNKYIEERKEKNNEKNLVPELALRKVLQILVYKIYNHDLLDNDEYREAMTEIFKINL